MEHNAILDSFGLLTKSKVLILLNHSNKVICLNRFWFALYVVGDLDKVNNFA